jgi:hypothetical protein
MKTSVVVLAALALMLFAGTMLAADGQSAALTGAEYAKAETNLLVGLKSDNQGLRESAAYMLGEMGSQKAVIPLMAMLKGGDSESSRIVAALALTRIGEARGVYAVKRAASFDPSNEVQMKCAFFVNEYAQPGAFHFAKTGGDAVLEMAQK